MRFGVGKEHKPQLTTGFSIFDGFGRSGQTQLLSFYKLYIIYLMRHIDPTKPVTRIDRFDLPEVGIRLVKSA